MGHLVYAIKEEGHKLLGVVLLVAFKLRSKAADGVLETPGGNHLGSTRERVSVRTNPRAPLIPQCTKSPSGLGLGLGLGFP